MSDIGQLLTEYKTRQEKIADSSDEFKTMLKAIQDFQLTRLKESHADLLSDSKTSQAANFLILGVYNNNNLRVALKELSEKSSALSIVPNKVLGSLVNSVEGINITDGIDVLATQNFLDKGISELSLENYLAVLRESTTNDERKRQFGKVKDLGKKMEDSLRGRMLKGGIKLARKPMEAAGLKAAHAFILESMDAVGSCKDFTQISNTFADRELAFSEKVYAGDRDPYVL